MPTVTASWFAKLPDGYMRMGISRGVPRGMPAGFRRYTNLNPGTWFNSGDVETYRQRPRRGGDPRAIGWLAATPASSAGFLPGSIRAVWSRRPRKDFPINSSPTDTAH